MKRLFALAALLVACSGSSSSAKGNVSVFVVPEASITGGVDPGDGPENIQDGWRVDYDKFLVSVGNFRARSSASDATLADPRTFILDLKNAPTAGYVVSTFGDVDAVRFDKVGEDMPHATASSIALPPTSAADAQAMIAGNYALYFEARLSKTGGKSCNPTKPTECVDEPLVRVRWGFAMGTSFDDCASAQGDTGFAVPQGGTAQVKPTIHGDHWFFADVVEGAEVTHRYAQFVADCDLNHDGETTLDELAQVKASDVFPPDKYSLSGAIGGVPIVTARDYVQAQARTIHDFQGDGECPTRTILP